MKRTLVAAASLIGFASAAGAATLAVTPTNTADIPQSTFVPGETIVFRVDGNSEGLPGWVLEGRIIRLTAGGTAFGADQSQMFQTVNPLLVGAGFGDPMNQVEPSGQPVLPISETFLGHVSLVAGAPCSYTTAWTGLNFFGIGDYTFIGIRFVHDRAGADGGGPLRFGPARAGIRSGAARATVSGSPTRAAPENSAAQRRESGRERGDAR
jgi:hypothetical protein